MNITDVKLQAQWELDIELFEEAVEAEKDKLLNNKSWWKKVFPYKILIIRED